MEDRHGSAEQLLSETLEYSENLEAISLQGAHKLPSVQTSLRPQMYVLPVPKLNDLNSVFLFEEKNEARDNIKK